MQGMDLNKETGIRNEVIINVSPDAEEDIIPLFYRCATPPLRYTLSELLKDEQPINETKEKAIIKLDLSPAQFKTQIKKIHRLITHSLRNGQGGLLLYAEENPFASGRKIPLIAIHTDPEGISNQLQVHKLKQYLRYHAIFLDYQNPTRVLPRLRRSERQIPAEPYPTDINPDPQQLEAAEHISGPLRLIAPAGSGKTRTLINRIVKLINAGVKQERILAVAFNKKAAQEMESRLEALNISNINVCTLHSLGYEIVRKKYQIRFDEKESHEKYILLIKRLLPVGTAEGAYSNRFLETLLYLIQQEKNNLSGFEEEEARAELRKFDFQDFFIKLAEKQVEEKILTYEDMIYLAVQILISDERIREYYQNRFEYLLVDEFQDLNPSQLYLPIIIAMPSDNLFVVGDDDQMIYGWRGAGSRHIFNFPGQYESCAEITLRVNYRSRREIVERSKQLISNNRGRIPKRIEPHRKEGERSCILYKGRKLSSEAKEIAKWIKKRKKRGVREKQSYAVLFRYNIQLFPAAIALQKRGIPYFGMQKEIIERIPAVKRIITLLEILEAAPGECEKEIKALRIAEGPQREKPGSGSEAAGDPETGVEMRELMEKINAARGIMGGAYRFKTKISKIFKLFNISAKKREANRVNAYYDYPREEAVTDTIKKTIIESGSIKEALEFFNGGREKEADSEDRVILTSVHRAKGLEFDNVAILHYSDDLDLDTPEKLEEERRVFYVAVTRAKENLLVTTPRTNPAIFIQEFFQK